MQFIEKRLKGNSMNTPAHIIIETVCKVTENTPKTLMVRTHHIKLVYTRFLCYELLMYYSKLNTYRLAELFQRQDASVKSGVKTINKINASRRKTPNEQMYHDWKQEALDVIKKYNFNHNNTKMDKID